jgi:AhpD family alkylhydroperoxidase
VIQSRMTSPALTVPGLMDALEALGKAVSDAAGEASQINGCAICLDMHSRAARKAGESDERLLTLAGWRDTPYFNEAERAALALTEAGTRLADRSEAVPEEVFNDAAEHFDQQALGALVAAIAAINVWNRLNVITGQVTGGWVNQWVA